MKKVERHDKTTFIHLFNRLEDEVADIAESHGWNIPTDKEKLAGKIALMHSELSEALEALRNGNPLSDHISEFTEMEEEFADVIIRIMHFSKRARMRVAAAMIAKMEFNESRPYKHGGKKF